VTAAALVDRVVEDLVGLTDGSQNVIEMRSQLGMTAQDLLPPQLLGHNDAYPRRIFGLSHNVACHQRSVSDFQA
jgi:hypothetical protein